MIFKLRVGKYGFIASEVACSKLHRLVLGDADSTLNHPKETEWTEQGDCKILHADVVIHCPDHQQELLSTISSPPENLVMHYK